MVTSPVRPRDDYTPGSEAARQVLASLPTAIQRVAFWLAILLPLAYTPVLLTGLSSLTDGIVFTSLLSANLLALYVGRSYEPATPE